MRPRAADGRAHALARRRPLQRPRLSRHGRGGRLLERIDLAGVYKFWERFRPDDLSDEQRRFLMRSRFIRHHFWVPRLHCPGKGV